MNRQIRYTTPTRWIGAAVLAVFALAATAKDKAAPPPRVDVQASLCTPADKIKTALHLKADGAPISAWMFDNASLSLFEKGLRIRLRENRKGAELTLKAANQDCAQMAPDTIPAGQGKCEYDSHGGSVAGALSLSRNVSAAVAADLVSGRTPLASALSPAQIRFLESVPGAWPLPDALRTLGPIKVSSFGAKPYVVDISDLPGGEQFIEISRKGPFNTADAMRLRMDQDLQKSALTLCPDQTAQAVVKLRALLKN